MTEALGTREILDDLSAIITSRFQTVREDGAVLSLEKRSGWGFHYFLEQLVLVMYHIPGLERVTLVEVDPDGMVHLMHLLLSVWVDIYLTSRRLFACLGELPANGLPPVVEISHETFAVRHSVRAVPRVDHVTHLWGTPPTDWHTRPYKRLG